MTTSQLAEGNSLLKSCSTGDGVTAASNDWKIWQLVDATLPTGGFAHSFGIEASMQRGKLHNKDAFVATVNQILEQVAGQLFPIVYHSWLVVNDPSRCRKALEMGIDGISFLLDEEEPIAVAKDSSAECTYLWWCLSNFTDSLLTNHVAHRASLSQGQALLRVAAKAFADSAPILQLIKHQTLVRDGCVAHHAPIFGVICGALGISAMTCQRMILYLTLRDMLSAATRLNVIGPMEASCMLVSLTPKAEEILRQYHSPNSLADCWQICPSIEVVQGQHDTLYTRLFNS